MNDILAVTRNMILSEGDYRTLQSLFAALQPSTLDKYTCCRLNYAMPTFLRLLQKGRLAQLLAERQRLLRLRQANPFHQASHAFSGKDTCNHLLCK
jgi:hypothetical protein